MPDEFVDSEGPEFVDAAGPEFVDAPGPEKFQTPSQMLKKGRWQDLLEDVTFANKTTSKRRPDGAVFIKEVNDPRFKGQEGWHFYDPKTGIWVKAPDEDTTEMSWFKRNLGTGALKGTARNIKAGFQAPFEAVEGLAHDVANVIGLEGDKSYIENTDRLEQRERYRQAMRNVTGGSLDQAVGAAVPATAYAMITKRPPPSAPYVSQLAASGLQVMPYTFATTPGSVEDRTKAAMISGITAPAFQVGIDKGLKPLTQMISGAIKKAPVGPTASAAQKEGVELSTGELLGKKTKVGRLVSGIEESGEPTMSWFTDVDKARGQAGTAAGRLLKQVQQKGRAMGFESEAELQQAIKADPGNDQLRALERLIKKAGSNDPADVAQASVSLKNWSTRKYWGSEFDKARAASRTAPVQHSEANNITTTADKLIEEFDNLPATVRENNQAYKELVSLKDDYVKAATEGPTALNASGSSSASLEALSRQSSEAAKGQVRFKVNLKNGEITPLIGPDAVDARATRGFAIVQRGTGAKPWTVLDHDPAFTNVSDKIFGLRPKLDDKFSSKDVQSAIKSFQPQGEPVNKDLLTYEGLDRMRSWLGDKARESADNSQKRVYKFLQNAVVRDQEALAKANPGTTFSKTYERAKKGWAEEVVPYEDNAIAKTMTTSTPDEVYQQFVRRGALEDRGQKFFARLDPKGQMAVKERMLTDAIDNATDRTAPGQPFDPHKFVGYLDQYRGAKGTIFKGDDGDALEGLVNVMQHMKSKSSSSIKPTFFSSMTAGGSAILNAGPVRRLLISANGLKPGSGKLDTIVAKLLAIEVGTNSKEDGNDDVPATLP